LAINRLDCYDRYREDYKFTLRAVVFQRRVADMEECAAECDLGRKRGALGVSGGGCNGFSYKR
jgi:hypothetical protein